MDVHGDVQLAKLQVGFVNYVIMPFFEIGEKSNNALRALYSQVTCRLRCGLAPAPLPPQAHLLADCVCWLLVVFSDTPH
jgi:hypothetical protein